MPKIYALLVGIDKYPSPIPPLRGCVNDILAVEDYLNERVDRERYQLKLLTLKNQEATRQAIIDGFRKHLCGAQINDVALFYFSGHGSQEDALPEFWCIEPDQLDETLVCWDSRAIDSWDLADKEIAKLINEVAQQNPHIVIILDCCHSGSGTRGRQQSLVRCAPKDQRQRPLSSFIVSSEEVTNLSAIYRNQREISTNWFTLSQGQHILLAACRDSEMAQEYYVKNQVRGAFSFFLMDTLQRTLGGLTYRDLFKQVEALVCNKVSGQSPQLEATNSQYLDQLFLDGSIIESYSYFTVSYSNDYGWVIDGGAVHGMPPVSDFDTTRLALFSFDSTQEQLSQLSQSQGEAKVIEVLPTLSKVSISGIQTLSSETSFKAVVLSWPLLPKGVYLEGEEDGIHFVRQTLTGNGEDSTKASSLYVHEVKIPEKAEFHILSQDNIYTLTRMIDDHPLGAQIKQYTWRNASQVLRYLEHIVRWTNILELSNPLNSRIRDNSIEMQIITPDGKEIHAPSVCLEYRMEAGLWKQPAFCIKLKNNSSKELYCTLLDLTETYGVFANFFASGGVWLKPGEEAWANDGKLIPARVLNKFWKQGIIEFKDVLKLIVCTSKFDAWLLEQPDIDFLDSKSIDRKRKISEVPKTAFNLLIKRVQNRHFGTEKVEFWDDWFTRQIHFTTVRPSNSKSV